MQADLPVANDLTEGVGFPPDWLARPLKDVADIRFSSVDKKTSSSEVSVRLCNYTDVYFNDYITADMAFMKASATRSEIARFGLLPGDVIITKDSETPDDIGVPALVDSSAPDLLCGYHLAMLRPLPGRVDPAFLAKQIAHNRILRYFGRQANGSTRYGLSTGAIERTPLWLPSFADQREIGRILRLLDAVIERTEAMIVKLKHLRLGLLRDVMTCGITLKGEVRDRLTSPKLFKQSPLGAIPADWKAEALGSIARIRRGASPRPIDDPRWFADSGPGWVRISDVTRSVRYLTTTEQRLSFDGAARSVRVYPGQVLMSIAATVGLSILCGMHACIHDGFVVFDQHEDHVVPEFLSLLLNFNRARIVLAGQTGTQANINTKIAGQIVVALPPLDEQKRILQRLAECDAALDAEMSMLQTLERVRVGISHDLLTGVVKVQDASFAEVR